jgi:hypothetical protein
MAVDLIAEGQAFLGGNPQVVRVKKVTFGFDEGDVLAQVDEAGAQGTYALVNVPAGTLVLDVLAYTREAWTASVTLTVGDGTDADGFLASAKIAPTSAQSNGILKGMDVATAEAFSGGRLYSAADTIDVVVGGADPDAGITDFYIVYIENASEL